MKYLFIFILSLTFSYANKFYYEFDKKVEIETNNTTKSLNQTYDDIQEYTTTDGKTVKFKNQILVQCKESSYCEDDFEDLNLINFEKINDNTYLIKLEKTEDIFSFCQKLYEKEDIKSAHPNYIIQRVKR